MATAKKYLFDTSFDDRRAGALSPEVERLRAAAFEDGRLTGIAEAASTGEQSLSVALDRIASGMEQLHAEREAIREAMASTAAEIALSLLRKFLPELTRKHALDEIEGLLSQTLSELVGEPRIVVRVQDDLLDPLREHVGAIATRSGYEGDIVLLGDTEMSGGACRIEWADGGSDRDNVRLWRDIDEAAKRLLGASAPPAPAGPEPIPGPAAEPTPVASPATADTAPTPTP